VGRLALLPFRLKTALSYYYAPLTRVPVWLLTSREHTNFTYDLDDLNKDYLASFVSVITRAPLATIKQYIRELDADDWLRQHVTRLTAESAFRHTADSLPLYGRRAGWYAFIRSQKPKVVVESGIDKGLGSCVIAAALMRNAAEGHPGRILGIDIDLGAGFLFREPYSQHGELLFGSSLDVLRDLTATADIFIQDSNHSAIYERQELEAVKGKLAPSAIVLSDNAHCSDELLAFASRTNRQFLFFQEKPKRHWYPGAGIGAAWTEPEEPAFSRPNAPPAP
jgi:methyltransferase family protein